MIMKNIKKAIPIIIAVALSVVLLIQIIPTLFFFGLIISSSQPTDSFLISSESPDGSYKLEAYRTNGGATVDFGVKVYSIEENGKKTLVYNGYHEEEAEIGWINGSTVSINGITLDLSRGEKYDWRGPSYVNCGNTA